MTPECKKSSVREAASLIVSSTLPKTSLQSDHEQLPLDGMMTVDGSCGPSKKKAQAEVDVREVYFLIMHFLSDGPCRKTCAQLRNELSEYKLLPRRYHAWYSRAGACSGDEEDDGVSVPLSYSQLLERYSFIEKNHLVKLLEQLYMKNPAMGSGDAKNPTAADASTLLGSGSVSLLNSDQRGVKYTCCWRQADQVHGLTVREIGGGLARHHRAPSIRAASYAIVKPSVLVDRIQIIKTFRGHRNAVYCAIFDKSGEYIITGSDDRLVKIWSTATGFCLRSCRGHEGDITDLAVSTSNNLVASASNDCFIRVWRFPDGMPISVLRGHTCAVTAIAFSPRQGCEHHLLSTSDDGTCRIWDARDSSVNARIYAPKSEGPPTGSRVPAAGPPNAQYGTQILCCAFNASGTIFVTGSADKLARVWDACKWTEEPHGGPNHELDTLKGHEDDVNYVQFSGCAAPSRPFAVDAPTKDERLSKFRNSWFAYESIVTCSRDGSAIIWAPRPRKYHGKSGRWTKAYHLRVPPPPMPPQPPRGVPRQRLLPTPRGVNMIVWSLDNRYVLAAIMDCRICVWNAVDGSLVHSLTGHTKSTFVLDVHPYDPRIAMSAGYDGRVIIWDIWEGRTIHVYETGDFNLVDGKFSPDGTSIVTSDEVGQIYLLATGEGESQKDAKYDQFFLGDYRPLTRDVHGYVLDQETQLPPHQRNLQDLLCDANMIPYAEPYQSMYQQRRLGALGINWQPPLVQWAVGTMDDGIYFANDQAGMLLAPDGEDSLLVAHQGRTRWVEQPIEDDAMDWEQETVDDTGSDYTVSFENASDEDEREGSLTCTEESMDSLEEDDSSEDDEQSQRARLRRSERNKRKGEGVVITSSGRMVKRKYIEDGCEDFSIRRSKRRRKPKPPRQGSSSRRDLDQEQSSRPKRLAARNARLIFSQISAEEEEHMSPWRKTPSDTSENIDITGEEQRSSGQSSERECDEVEKNAEGLAPETEPSDVADCSRRKRSNMVVKLRIPQKKTLKKGELQSSGDQTPAQFALDQLVEGNTASEGIDPDFLASVPNEGPPQCKDSQTSNPQYGSGNVLMDTAGIDSSIEASSKTDILEGLHANVKSDDESLKSHVGSSREGKRRWEWKSLKAVKRARVGDSSEEPSKPNIVEPCSSKLDEVQILDGRMEAVYPEGEPTLPERCFQPEDNANQEELLKGPAVTCDVFGSDMLEVEGARRGVMKSLRPEDAEQELDNLDKGEALPEQKEEDILDNCGGGEMKPFQEKDEFDDFRCILDHMVEKPRSPGCDHSEGESVHEADTSSQNGQRQTFVDPCIGDHIEQEGNAEDQETASSLEHAPGMFKDSDLTERAGFRSGGDADLSDFLEHTYDIPEERKLEHDAKNYASGLYEEAHLSEPDCVEANLLESNNLSVKKSGGLLQQQEIPLQEAGPSVEDDSVVENENIHTSKEHDVIEEETLTDLKARNTCMGVSEAATGIRRHQLKGTSWQHNSPTCIWLRQGISEPEVSEPTTTGQEERNRDAEEGIERDEEGNAGCEEDATFPCRRGKRETGNQRKRASSHQKSLPYVRQRQGRSETISADFVQTGEGNIESDFDARKSRFSVRTRRNGQEERLEGAELIDRTEEGNDDCKIDVKVSRFTSRSRSSLGQKEPSLHSDGGKMLEDLKPWKGKKRSKKKVSWLMLTEVEEGTRYIPQLGDEVAYVMQGQDEYPKSAKLEDKGPSKTLRTRLRAVEICRVVGLDYNSLSEFVGTCCKLTLKLIDEDCKACGKTFRLSLPELTDFPDFVIERSRYEDGMRRNWTKRDKCKVWWRSADEKGGQWWEGRVILVESKSSKFPDSPWEQCVVRYKGQSTEDHRHSPWELFDLDSTVKNSSHIDDPIKLRVLSAVGEVEESCKSDEDEYGLRQLRKLIHKPDFLNKTHVPLLLETIKARLHNNYYRSLDALRYDIELLVTNAQNFACESEFTAKMRRLASRLLEDLR